MPIDIKFPKPGSERKLGAVLGKVANNIDEIRNSLDGLSQVDFARSRMIHNSVYLDLATIGEEVKKITGNPEDENVKDPDPYGLMEAFPNVAWHDIKGFRDITDHNYFVVNPNIVWHSVGRTIDSLEDVIVQISESYPGIAEEIEKARTRIDSMVQAAIDEAEIDESNSDDDLPCP